MGTDYDFPAWAISLTIMSAIGVCIFGFLDQNPTSLLINWNKFGVEKTSSLPQGLLTWGVFIYQCA